jgi:hypothetical protein
VSHSGITRKFASPSDRNGFFHVVTSYCVFVVVESEQD